MHSERFEELAALQALGIPLESAEEEFARHLAGCATCKGLMDDFNASAAALASNPDLFHAAASAVVDLNNPAPAAIASGRAALIAFNNVLRY